MLRLYGKILDLLDARERRRFYILMGIMVVVAFASVAGISMVLVLLGILAQPDRISTDPRLSWINDALGFGSVYGFQVFMALMVFLAVMAGIAAKAAGSYILTRFASGQGYRLSARLLSSYLHQPYSWFLSRNSSNVSKTVLSEVDQLIARTLTPGLQLLSNVMMAGAIIAFLIVMDPLVSILAATLMGASYTAIYFRLRQELRALGERMLKVNGQRYRVVQEATGGIKEIKLMGLESSYVTRFEKAARSRADFTARLQVMSAMPRYVLEALAFAIMLTLILVLLKRNEGDLLATIPVLGTFAFAIMRLLPAFQQIYSGFAALRGSTAVLDQIHKDYAQRPSERSTEVSPPLPLMHELELRNICYSYVQSGKSALQDVSLSIPARSTVGIVGGTGAGKTTLVDLVLGLLSPEHGELVVDGTAIDSKNLRAWQRTLGYVPQSIYLTDDTVARNIAFGVEPRHIDMAAVEKAARTAALHDFVMTDLPGQYETVVGERGVRLSGGQRQRIGIARALYADPSLLIMDEATSALDNITESVVMEAIQNIGKERTIILIAHRLSTVRNCDTIYLLENGRVVTNGTYDELVMTNERFRKMAIGV